MAKRGRLRVRNARAKRSHKTLKMLVTKAQAASLGEDFSDVGCPFALSGPQKAALKAKKAAAKKRKAGRKK
jgi:hypothetical protein